MQVKLEYYYIGKESDDGEIEIIPSILKPSRYYAVSVQFQ
jgi:hypothetical protein